MAEEFQLGGGNWWENNTSTSSRNRNYGDSSSQMNIRAFSLDQNNPILSHSSNYQVVDNLQVLHSSMMNSHQFLRSPLSSEQPPLPPPAPPLPPPHNQLHFSNNTPFWNASASTMNDVPSSLFPSNLHNIPQLHNNTIVHEKAKNMREVRDINKIISKKTSSTETSNKRSRNETPFPSPIFKVRKEKMGDRITALQQLVSPFGKTDTASVLSEAIEYIKFLHDQIGALSAPYMKSGASMHHQKNDTKSEDNVEGRNKDLRSRGLCLVPTSSTFPVTHETTVDLWTPTFGSTYR